MKIVIDIPDKEYERLDYIDHLKLRAYIDNGTPLPKGHGRLIEVTDRMMSELFTFQRYTGIDEAPYEDATRIIDNAPTVIEADAESEVEK